MNTALREDPGALRVNLTVPTTTVRLGPIAFDGLQALIGVDLADLLSPLMIGPKTQRPVLGGVVDVYPLAIPDGEGLTIPVKLAGEVGFRNYQGFLILILPAALTEVVEHELAAEIAAKRAIGPRMSKAPGGGYVAEFAVRMVPGMRKAVKLGTWGEIGVEAA